MDIRDAIKANNTAIEAIDLVKDYGSGSNAVHALRDVNIAFEQGKFTVIMGPSGSGKSTLLHILAGIDLPTSGQVTYHVRNNCAYELTGISDQDRTMLRRNAFGFVFQSGQLLPELPAIENIALPMMLGGASYQQATDTAMLWLERLGLRQLAQQRPGEMSGGQMQRIAIARALAAQPAVIFADEPTGALDSKNARSLMEKLSGLNADAGTTILMVTHDCNAASYCKRILFIQDGVLFHELRRDVPDETQQAFYGRILAVMAQLGGGSANVL